MSDEPTQTTPSQTETTPSDSPSAESTDPSGTQPAAKDVHNSDDGAPATTADAPAEVSDGGSPAPFAKKILIGSQRDPADPKLSPQKPKPVREAAKLADEKPPNPETVESGVATTESAASEESTDSTVPAVDSAASTETSTPSPTEVTPTEVTPTEATSADPEPAIDDEPEFELPKVEIKPDLGDDLEREINEALDGMSLDQVIAGQDTALSGGMLEEGSRHKGTVVKVHRDDVFFSLGGAHEGVVSLRQFKKPPKSGMMTDVIVRGFNADDGLYELGIPGASVSVSDWSDIAEGAVIEVRISGSNTGGLECMIHNIRGFIPASQIATHRVENLSEYINQKLQCVVQEVNPRRRKLVLSHRAVMERDQQEKRKEIIESIKPGQVCEGTVSSLRDFGAFVDLGGGVDGLIHISKLSWDRVEHPKEVLTEGQKIKVKVEKVSSETGKIGLSYRDLLEHPWDNVEAKYPANSIVNGTVSRVANFGAFVRLESGVEGMIHISELAHHRVVAVTNVVQEGQEVECKILSVDRDAQRMALSLKALIQTPDPKAAKKVEDSDDEPPRELAVPPRKGPLKGGRDKPSGGEQFGLNW